MTYDNSIQRVTDAWSAWVAKTDPETLRYLTCVQLNTPGHGGYGVHVQIVGTATQAQVDAVAAAFGAPGNDGWEPASGRVARQWSVSADIDSLNFHLTATADHKTGSDQ